MTIYDDAIAHYIDDLYVAQEQVFQKIFEAIPQRGLPAITIKPEEGRFLRFLVHASQAQTVVEIGTLGGYSGLWLAQGLSPTGKLITLEKEPAHAAVAAEHFALGGVAERVDLRVGDAHALLPRLAQEGPFDFCFIDAEKTGYDAYLAWALANIRRGGIVAAHNAFKHGQIADPANQEPDIAQMRTFNARFVSMPQLLTTIFPAGDGLLVGLVC